MTKMRYTERVNSFSKFLYGTNKGCQEKVAKKEKKRNKEEAGAIFELKRAITFEELKSLQRNIEQKFHWNYQ